MCYRYMQRQASMRKESDETAAPVETRQDERVPARETRETAFTRFMTEMKRWMAQRERETSGS